MTELMGPIIGITLVLMAVFLPASFIAGITGQMYRQFALVIAATALISGIIAITLKPTQAASYLKPLDPHAKKNAQAISSSHFMEVNEKVIPNNRPNSTQSLCVMQGFALNPPIRCSAKLWRVLK